MAASTEIASSRSIAQILNLGFTNSTETTVFGPPDEDGKSKPTEQRTRTTALAATLGGALGSAKTVSMEGPVIKAVLQSDKPEFKAAATIILGLQTASKEVTERGSRSSNFALLASFTGLAGKGNGEISLLESTIAFEGSGIALAGGLVIGGTGSRREQLKKGGIIVSNSSFRLGLDGGIVLGQGARALSGPLNIICE